MLLSDVRSKQIFEECLHILIFKMQLKEGKESKISFAKMVCLDALLSISAVDNRN